MNPRTLEGEDKAFAPTMYMAMELSPGRVATHYFLGLVLLAQGNAPAALVAIEQETGDWAAW